MGRRESGRAGLAREERRKYEDRILQLERALSELTMKSMHETERLQRKKDKRKTKHFTVSTQGSSIGSNVSKEVIYPEDPKGA